ncbi:putative hyaluronidase [Apostichopus japonicus]|uniref:Hyaluronidase n=1 Tax=Stichopus japonicus TaxID=307972 RepID=A0A2G8K3D6_STIJA|nr:putative hyaluronidase [Apostichopus japonicus]
MDSTLRLVKELRPHAKWGFYHFPYCNNGKEPQRACSPGVEASNENITWLFDSSTALYPSIYLHGQETEMRDYVNGVVTEALRVRKLSNNKFADIFPYTRYLYSHSELFFTKEDLNATILQSAQMGCSGVVFWGSNNDTHTSESCSQLQSYLQVSLGPWVKRVTDAASLCSLNICSANGRCVGDILTCASSWQKLEGKGTHEKEILGMRDNRGKQSLFPCTCDCYEGWSGTSCSISG